MVISASKYVFARDCNNFGETEEVLNFQSLALNKAVSNLKFIGSCGVHLVGGSSALAAAWLIGPRLGRWQVCRHVLGSLTFYSMFNVHPLLQIENPTMGSPPNAVIGLFMLWWGWLAFNAGSTFGKITIEHFGSEIFFRICLPFISRSKYSLIQRTDLYGSVPHCRRVGS